MELVVRNGLVATANDVFRADIGVKDGRVVQIADRIDAGEEIIDAAGKIVCPAGVEIHTHIDVVMHGMRTVDDWYDASLGAAFGGTATIVDFPLQGPNQSLLETIEEYKERAAGRSIVDYAFTPTITQYTEETYAEIPRLIGAGMPTFKVFMYYAWKVDDYNLARVLDVIGSNGGIAGVHCENAGLIDYLIDRAIKSGRTGVEWHAPTRPVNAEVEATERVIRVVEALKVPVLIVHMSAAPAVQLVAAARARGVQVYGEAMPHFLLLDDSCYESPGYEGMKYVITPPLRPKDHQEILWANLAAGALVTVGSDHCAFPYKDKMRLFEANGAVFPMIPHGAPGIETRVPLMFSEGVSKGRLSLSRFVEVMATNPARLAGLYPRKGTIAVGSDADFVIIDPEARVTLAHTMLHGKTDYTPFEGWELQGYPVMTIGRGKVLVRDGELVAQRGVGQFLERNRFEPF